MEHELNVGGNAYTGPLRAAYLAAVEAGDEAAIDAAIDAAAKALIGSGEGRLVRIVEAESGVDTTVWALSEADARKQAREWIREGAYGDIDRTTWCDAYLYLETQPTRDRYERPAHYETVTVAIAPDEPACTENDHEWGDGPVQGHGGGIVYTSRCAHCRLERTTDTWATRQDNGVQGLDSISYSRPDHDDE